MGQPINVTPTVLDDVLILDADRSVSGQDGGAFDSAESATGNDSFPARLAVKLFEADEAINHVYAGSNGIVVRRSGGWPSDAVGSATELVASFFVFYDH